MALFKVGDKVTFKHYDFYEEWTIEYVGENILGLVNRENGTVSYGSALKKDCILAKSVKGKVLERNLK